MSSQRATGCTGVDFHLYEQAYTMLGSIQCELSADTVQAINSQSCQSLSLTSRSPLVENIERREKFLISFFFCCYSSFSTLVSYAFLSLYRCDPPVRGFGNFKMCFIMFGGDGESLRLLVRWNYENFTNFYVVQWPESPLSLVNI